MKKCLIVLWLWTVPVLFAGRPNILFIYTDDQSHRTVGCDPRSFDWVTTPNIDQLAAQGIRFDRAQTLLNARIQVTYPRFHPPG